MTTPPRVSVVVPAYNNAAYIVETVDSILAQTYPDFELIVADHSSTDATPDLLARYAGHPRVRLLTTEAGGGAERNWNRATEAATGELVKLVCGDDVIYPDCLADQVATFDRYGDALVMTSSARDIVDASGKPIVKAHGLAGLDGLVPGREAIRLAVRRGANIFGEPFSVLLRRSVLDEVGNWQPGTDYMIDQATYSQVLLHGSFAPTPGALGAFRVSATQWSVALVREQSASAAKLHEDLAASVPGLLTRADVRRGNAMARLRAIQRRLVYLVLAKRLKPPSVVE